MGPIFISHRREDSEEASRLFDDLTRQFGKGAVCLGAGERGRAEPGALEARVASCPVLLSLMGSGWLEARDAAGNRRLDDPGDVVRRETAAALARGIPVIVVRVQGARSPLVTQLPAELAELAFRDGVELTSERRAADVAGLVRALRPHLGPSAGARASALASSRHSLRLGAVLAAAVLGGGVAYGIQRNDRDVRSAAGYLQGRAEAAATRAATPEPAAAPPPSAPEHSSPAELTPRPAKLTPRPAEAPPSSPTVTLVSWWSAARRDHLLTAEPPWSGNTGERQDSYVFARDEAIIFDPAAPQPPGTVPLFSWRSDGRKGAASRDYFTTSAPLWRASPDALGARRKAERARDGYHPYRLEGYVYDPAAPQPPGTRPLFSWYSAVRDDYLTTAQPEWCLPIAKRGVRCQGTPNGARHRDGYGFVRLEGYVR